jgi:hypothetical protein
MAAKGKGLSLTFMTAWVLASTAYQVLAFGLPHAEIMGGIGVLALAVNAASVLLLLRSKGSQPKRQMRVKWPRLKKEASRGRFHFEQVRSDRRAAARHPECGRYRECSRKEVARLAPLIARFDEGAITKRATGHKEALCSTATGRGALDARQARNCKAPRD